MTAPSEEQPRFYSQAAAVAMHAELEQQRETTRRLKAEIGILHREADRQAETAQRLREDVEKWRTHYTRATTKRGENI